MYPASHHFPPSSVAAIILSHLGYCHGLLSHILSLPQSKSCRVFLISLGIKPQWPAELCTLSAHPTPLCPHLLSPGLPTPATLASVATFLVVLYLLTFLWFVSPTQNVISMTAEIFSRLSFAVSLGPRIVNGMVSAQ